MAGISLPYRASEPSAAETALAQIATDPARAGAAMALLPGYMSLRQDVGAAAQANADRNFAIEMMKQNELAQHNIAEEGIHGAGINTPGGRALFYGSAGNRVFGPEQQGLVGGLTNLEVNKENADIYQKVMQGNYQGVEGGVDTPVGALQGMTGLPVQQGTPLQIRVQQMRDAAAAARQGADAEKLQFPKYGIQIAPDGSEKYVATYIPPGQEAQVGQQLLQMNQNLAKSGVTTEGTPAVAPAPQQLPVIGTPVGKKSGRPGDQVVVRPGSPTSAAGAALPPAKTEGGGPAPQQGSSAPQQGRSGVGVITPIAPPPGGNQTLDAYHNLLVKQGMDPAQAAQLRNSGMHFGRGQDGSTWILVPGQKPYGPLKPNG